MKESEMTLSEMFNQLKTSGMLNTTYQQICGSFLLGTEYGAQSIIECLRGDCKYCKATRISNIPPCNDCKFLYKGGDNDNWEFRDELLKGVDNGK